MIKTIFKTNFFEERKLKQNTVDINTNYFYDG